MMGCWSGIGRPPAGLAKSRGFTLLELLVSMVIIGLILSMAVLSVGGQGRADEVEKEARRLAALLELASQEAIMKSRELGIRFTPHGYQFIAFEKGAVGGEDRWQEYTDAVLKTRELPEGLVLELFLEGLPVTLETEFDKKISTDKDEEEDKDGKDKKEKIQPQIMLFSSGERTPFELTIDVDDDMDPGSEELGYHLKGEMLGTLEVTKKDAL